MNERVKSILNALQDRLDAANAKAEDPNTITRQYNIGRADALSFAIEIVKIWGKLI